MTLILSHCRFLHVPKTGGTWVTGALQAGCIVLEDFRVRGSDHVPAWRSPHPERFTLAFVRHPLPWWRSFWRFHKGPARRYIVDHEICATCWAEDYATFVERLLTRFPGHYGRLVERVLGPIGDRVDFVGRHEHLLDDLLLALRLAGQPHNADAIRAVPAANVSAPLPAALPADLESALLAAEQPLVRRFGYDGLAPADPAAARAWADRPPAPAPPPGCSPAGSVR